MAYNYKFISHTADRKIKLEADSLEGLFRAGLEGMNRLLKKNTELNTELNTEEKILINSADVTALLIDFLSEILTLSYEKKVIFSQVEFTEFSETDLRAKVSGSEVDDGFNEDIKAVTYHEADVKRNESGKWKTGVIFDI